VAVGGSEAGLLAQVSGRPHVHVAQGVGAAGIAEALAHFGLDDYGKEYSDAV